jgi:release factor glutamine methyltransferase
MNLSTFYRNFIGQLQQIYSTHEAANITAMCFEKIAGITKSDVIKNPDFNLSEIHFKNLETSVSQLLLHKPVQYVLGEAWFYKLKFKIDENVLIPRPETEELVNEVFDFLRESSSKKIIDIGTGSGCIPITIKAAHPETRVTAIDVDEHAIAIAIKNASIHKTEIEFVQMNFLNKNKWNVFEKFDIVISNPPYIPIREKELMDKNVTNYEPHLALFVPDEKPLLFYEAIALFSKMHLAENGKIFMEVHENLAKEVSELFSQHQFQTEIKKDIFEKERMVMATHYR